MLACDAFGKRLAGSALRAASKTIAPLWRRPEVRALTTWLLVALLSLPLTTVQNGRARAQAPEAPPSPEVSSVSAPLALPSTEAARVERLKAVAAAHQLTLSEARHQADTQLFAGALILITSLLAPLIAEIRDEEFPALGSLLIGSIGLAVIIEGSLDEQDANRIRGQASLQDQIDRIEGGNQTPGNAPPPEQDPEDDPQR
jgi:hypothetical protein